MSDPYVAGITVSIPKILRSPLSARVAGVIDTEHFNRGLKLIPQRTRCIKRFDVHELLLTDETGVSALSVVDRSFGLGFVEFLLGGIIVEGDIVTVRGQVVGNVAGFDETHLPNHQNILLRASSAVTGIGLGIQPGDQVLFEPPS
jgi:hypothetical protein